MLYSRCRTLQSFLCVLLVYDHIPSVYAQPPPVFFGDGYIEPSFFHCDRPTRGLLPFFQDLFNDITCPINNSIYFLFNLIAVFALFIIILSLIGKAKNKNTIFLTARNFVCLIIVIIYIIAFTAQYDPPYFYFPGFSREKDNVAQGESFLDCEKDSRFFIHFTVNFLKV
jgi:hypothetical protein